MGSVHECRNCLQKIYQGLRKQQVSKSKLRNHPRKIREVFGKNFINSRTDPFLLFILDLSDSHSRAGVIVTLCGALLIIFFLKDPFQGLIWSQIILSIQLLWTISSLIFLTSSAKVMGRFATSLVEKIFLGTIAAVVSFLNIMLLTQIT